jgi:diketogulonate reductase-like aldo/keto reductase
LESCDRAVQSWKSQGYRSEFASVLQCADKVVRCADARAAGATKLQRKVSNFSVRLLKKLIDETGVVPAVNQVEAHPALQQPELEGELLWFLDQPSTAMKRPLMP